MWVFGVGQSATSVSEFSYAKFSQEQKNKELATVTHSNFEVDEIIIIESEPEIEFKIEWFKFENTSCNFILKPKEKKIQFKEFSNFSSKKTIPLFDLYCNWKFHLS